MKTYTIEVADETGTELDLLLAERTDGLTVETLLRTHLETTAAAGKAHREEAGERGLEQQFRRLSRQEKVEALEKTKP